MVYGCKKKRKSVCGEEIAVAADGAETEKKKGILKSLKQLSLYEEFTPQDLERISHYICFE